jgi:hypothetical protein
MRRLLLLSAIVLAACTGDSGSLRDRFVDKDFRALVYSKAFADRFALPAKDAIALEPGVLGMAIHVTQASDSNPICMLYLYMDDDVPVAYPSKTQDRIQNLDRRVGPLFFTTKLNEVDGTARLDRLSDLPVLYLSRSYGLNQKRGVTDGGSAWAYYRDLLPALNVVVYSPVCSGLAPANGPADVWLRRFGHEDADLGPSNANLDVAVRIPVPMSLLEAASDATAHAAKQAINFDDPPPPKYVVPSAK